jgi:hypothetical protein
MKPRRPLHRLPHRLPLPLRLHRHRLPLPQQRRRLQKLPDQSTLK